MTRFRVPLWIVYFLVILDIIGCTFVPIQATLTPTVNVTDSPITQTPARPTVTPTLPDLLTLTPTLSETLTLSDTLVLTVTPTMPPVGARAGNTARDFSLKNMQAELVALSDLRGQAVLINFWATWCVYCLDEMPELQAVHDDMGDQGLIVLGIDVGESREQVQAFVEELGITFPVLLDQDAKIAIGYNIRGLPTSVLINPQGIIHAVHLGPIDRQQVERYLDQMEIE